MLRALDGGLDGLFLMGQNPAVGSQHSGLQRRALGHLKWLVVRELAEIESARFWKDSPEISSGELRSEDIGTEVFLMPAATHIEKEGCFTNTRAARAVARQGARPAGRLPVRAVVHAPPVQARARAAGRLERHARLADPEPDGGTTASTRRTPSRPPRTCSARSTATTSATGDPLAGFAELKNDGSTACGCWIYSGIYADGVNQARRREPGDLSKPGGWVAPEWAWAWPANRRALYNRASARPDGAPWSERKRYVWWDAEEGKWTGYDVPDFPVDKPPDYVAPPDARGMDAISGSDPFIMQADGRGWLFSPAGLLDGPMPTHYEPIESPVHNLLYPEIDDNPAALRWSRAENPVAENGDPRWPCVATTFRLTEHHTAGGMSRWVPWLAELQPEMFAEIDPVLARERGIEDGGWMTILSLRAEIEARAKVTDRIKPLRIGDRLVHQVGLPWHWGFAGPSPGDAANDLGPLSGEPNVSIQESKAYLCNVRAGRNEPRHLRCWPASTTRRPASLPTATIRPRRGHTSDRDRDPSSRRPAHGLLHRHHDVHRLQGVRGGVQAVERPAVGRRRRSGAAARTTTPAS